ncbi:MAG: hypothetical protein ACR2HP_14185 [Ilumatobacteraceae bacterium]
MSLTSRPQPSTRVGARPTMFDVPIALWAYGLLRSLAFAAPAWTEDGRIGLGVIVVLALYVVVLVKRSRGAWIALVALDVLSFTMLITVWLREDDAPLIIPILAGAALVALLLPSTRRYLNVDRARRRSSIFDAT